MGSRSGVAGGKGVPAGAGRFFLVPVRAMGSVPGKTVRARRGWTVWAWRGWCTCPCSAADRPERPRSKELGGVSIATPNPLGLCEPSAREEAEVLGEGGPGGRLTWFGFGFGLCLANPNGRRQLCHVSLSHGRRPSIHVRRTCEPPYEVCGLRPQ